MAKRKAERRKVAEGDYWIVRATQVPSVLEPEVKLAMAMLKSRAGIDLSVSDFVASALANEVRREYEHTGHPMKPDVESLIIDTD